MQNYNDIADNDYVSNGPNLINNNIKTVMSENAGSDFPAGTFPTGTKCFRTDEQAVYRLDAEGSWVKEYDLRSEGGIIVAYATKLAAARTITVDLASTTAASFDGSENVEPGVKGVLPITRGGTGATTAADALANLGAYSNSGGLMRGSIKFTNDSELRVAGGEGTTSIYLLGTKDNYNSNFLCLADKNHDTPKFELGAGNGTTSKRLVGKPDGTLTWDGKTIVTPVGTVFPYAGNNLPTGFLMCDGSAISRTTYADLYSAIGTTYGSGDGSTTFNLPNLTDKFIQGSATAGTVKSAGLPNIDGDVGQLRGYGETGRLVMEGTTNGAFSCVFLDSIYTATQGVAQTPGLQKITFNASRSSSVYGNSTTVQPPALTMRYIIKY